MVNGDGRTNGSHDNDVLVIDLAQQSSRSLHSRLRTYLRPGRSAALFSPESRLRLRRAWPPAGVRVYLQMD